MRIETAEALEEVLGAELRTTYEGLRKDALSATLGRRRKPEIVGIKVCKVWLER